MLCCPQMEGLRRALPFGHCHPQTAAQFVNHPPLCCYAHGQQPYCRHTDTAISGQPHLVPPFLCIWGGSQLDCEQRDGGRGVGLALNSTAPLSSRALLPFHTLSFPLIRPSLPAVLRHHSNPPPCAHPHPLPLPTSNMAASTLHIGLGISCRIRVVPRTSCYVPT